MKKEHFFFYPLYLYTESLISLLQCFPFLFSQCHATIHPQSASVLNNKSPFGSFCLQDNQLSVSYSGSQPPCHIVLTCSLSLPPSAPCYLWKAKTAGVQRSSLELYDAFSQHAQTLPRDYGEALSETGNLPSPLPHRLRITLSYLLFDLVFICVG